MKSKRQVVVIGGGLAGLVSAYLLAKNSVSVILVEKKRYPFHRVCGEYISNETLDFLKRENLIPSTLDIPQIDTFQFSDTKGRLAQVKLDLGGFGISRYALDFFLFQRCEEVGVQVYQGLQVESVNFSEKEDMFRLKLSNHETLEADFVIGAFGKRSKLDKALDRDFIRKRSPYLGVKYHIKIDLPKNIVSLHNFSGGYCGVNSVEDDTFNLCYLGSRNQLRTSGSIPEMEEEFLFENPELRSVFRNADFLFKKPEVINEINFDPKSPVEDHILMAGDAAGLITPLCGNGMAIAILGGKLAAESILSGKTRNEIEAQYKTQWDNNFKQRLWVGRTVQKLFGAPVASGFTRGLIQNVPFAADAIIRQTHGQPF